MPTIGIMLVAFLAATNAGVGPGDGNVDFLTDKLCEENGMLVRRA